MADAAKWYVVHTYSGYENTVKATIEKTIQSRQLQDQVLVVGAFICLFDFVAGVGIDALLSLRKG